MMKVRRTAFLAVLVCQLFYMPLALGCIRPATWSVGVEGRFQIYFSTTPVYAPRVYFGELEADELYVEVYEDEEDLGTNRYILYGSIPKRPRSGLVDVYVTFNISPSGQGGGESRHCTEAFTYTGTTTIESISPNTYPAQPSDKRVTLQTRGVSDTPDTKVYFGDFPATDLVVEILGDSERITCLPPPFPGGAAPLSVPVRVESPFATATPLVDSFTYGPVPPVVVGEITALDAWRLGQQRTLTIDYLTPGTLRAQVVGIPSDLTQIAPDQLTLTLPALPPGAHPLNITNGDGGTYTVNLQYTGTPSTDFHPGDRDQNFRFNLSEVLRVVQFYNSGGLHCDPTSEDGYAPGVGADTSCAPYPADNAPFNWNLGLTELLGIIQFYNLHCYQPCPGAPGTYCPPD